METLEHEASGDLLLAPPVRRDDLLLTGLHIVVRWEQVFHRSDVHLVCVHPQAEGGD